MSEIINTITPYLPYIAPPILGAFIGYLTNKVAIRMLFRPLKQWRIGPLGIPMTPGVIPSKRHDLAINIGEMVGEHLLTSEEINNSLQKDGFQEHLYSLIESKVGSFMKQDLGPLPALVPPAYKNYFDIGHKIIIYQLKETVHDYMLSEDCDNSINRAVDGWIEELLERQLNTVIDLNTRESLYEFFKTRISTIAKGHSIEKWVKTSVSKKVSEIVNEGSSLEDILPGTLSQMIAEVMSRQTPFVIEKTQLLLEEPGVQEKIIKAIRAAIEDFIENFGPMAAMIQNFLDMDMVEEKIRAYLNEKDNDISKIIKDDEIKLKIESALRERTLFMLAKPLSDLMADFDQKNISSFCDQVSSRLLIIIQNTESTENLAAILKDSLEIQLAEGTRSVGDIACEMFGDTSVDSFRSWLCSEIRAIVRSATTQKAIDEMIEDMVSQLLKKPIGRLSNLIPAGVREGLYRSIQEMATRMLTSEVPGIVKSLNIRKIVTDRVDSFDLLRLERLLLSIMEEQFKYINLFGGFLGFLIGCINIIVLFGIR